MPQLELETALEEEPAQRVQVVVEELGRLLDEDDMRTTQHCQLNAKVITAAFGVQTASVLRRQIESYQFEQARHTFNQALRNTARTGA